MVSTRSALIVAVVAAGIVGWATYASHGADPAGPPADRTGSNWLAQADPQDDRPPPPPRRPDRGRWMDGKMPKEMRPLLAAGAKARVMKEYLDLAGDIERVVSNPLQATIVAVHGISDLAKDNPKQAAEALQSLLDQEESVAGRTVIHLGLKDIHEKAQDRQGTLDQLVAIIKENAQPLKDFEQRRGPMGRPGPEGDRESRPPRGRGPRPAESPPAPAGQ